jgi:predicted nucleotidyltransferase
MQAIFDLLAKCAQPLLIIGGHSLEAHGVSRQTADVDCLIASEDRDALDAIFLGGGFSQTGMTENFARYSHPSPLVPDVDALFVDRETFEKLSADTAGLQRGIHEFRVPALANLIALKLHAIRNNPAREARDLSDIAELLRANPGVVASDEIKTLCSRFGPPDFVTKLEPLLPK